MISWSADYLMKVLELAKADAAQAVSLFLGGMILGRWAVSRLLHRFSPHALVIVSLGVAGLGFLAYWQGGSILPGLVGLFVTGLGIAGLYPLTLSLTLGAAQGNSVLASVRTTLASGTAILILPLVLGRLADATGIQRAYGLVLVLLLGVLLITLITHPGKNHTAHPVITP
jgi:fucose permease